MGKNFVITLLSMLLVIAVTTLAVTTWKKNQEQSKETVQSEECLVPSPTIDERIESWKVEKDWENSYRIYLNLSEVTLREILKKIGTEASTAEIAHEYEENISYYIKSLIKDKILLNKDSVPEVDSLSLNIEAIKKKDIDKIIQL